MTDQEFDQAFAKARAAISVERARDIIRLKNWEHGMSGCLNAIKPEVNPVNEAENRLIHEVWKALPGSTCWMSVVFLLARD